MSLKFSDKPVLNYSGNQASDVWRRFPEGAQPIASAPERSATPILVHEANGTTSWALHHSGAWRRLAPFRDFRDGSVQWRMDGTEIAHPVAWSMPKRGWRMAWAGKPSARQRTAASLRSRTTPHPLPKLKSDNPNGIPAEVMQTLANERLSSDPAAFNRRLQELLAAYKLSDGR